MIEKTSSGDLRSALEQHLQETRNHVTRLERVFSLIGKEPDAKTNEIFDKMSSAVKDSISNIDDSPLRDAALIVGQPISSSFVLLPGFSSLRALTAGSRRPSFSAHAAECVGMGRAE